MLGVEVTVPGAGNVDRSSRRKGLLEDIAGAPRMVIGGDENDAAKMTVRAEFGEGSGFFFGIVRVLRERQDFFFGDTALDQVMLHEFDDTRAGAEAAAAGDNERSGALPDEL